MTKVALIQMHVTASKADNLRSAAAFVSTCAAQGAELVVLPEMFCCPYQASLFPSYAEPAGGDVWCSLAEMARENRVTLVGGSMPEVDDAGRVYNTSFTFGEDGRQLGRHRKMHLFDIDVSGGQRFRESDTLAPGSDITLVDTPTGRFGVAICYDVRFPELARLMALQGASALVYPGAFNMTTGPAHWEILFRARALDNQVYTLGCAPARSEQASYVSYGNSIAVSPWGDVVGRLGAEEGTLLVDLDWEREAQVRRELPLLMHRRTDVYEMRAKSNE